jgi:hypothetical protein
MDEEKTALFMSVTGSTLEEAKQYLEMSLMEMDKAVELYFSTSANANANANVGGGGGGGQQEDDVRAPMPARQDEPEEAPQEVSEEDFFQLKMERKYGALWKKQQAQVRHFVKALTGQEDTPKLS